MGTLATQLAVSRATLYRWFNREISCSNGCSSSWLTNLPPPPRSAWTPRGTQRVVEFSRRLMDATVQFQLLVRTFVDREPQLALRLLIGQKGAVHGAIARALREVVSEAPT